MITMIAFVPLGIDILVLKYIALMVLLIMIPVLCIFGFIYMLSCMLMIGNFSVDMKILDFVNFKKAYAHIRDNWANYLILLLLLIALSLILQVGAFILALTIVGVIIIPAFMFYMYLVSADLVAQFMKTKREE